VLGFKYRPTGTGQYSHTIRIHVLDREGVVVDHADGLERPLEPIAARVSALLASEAPGK
jgi:cytochrome oxidase Cu insertion factor (SCO1/SenC/PrrC family)